MNPTIAGKPINGSRPVASQCVAHRMFMLVLLMLPTLPFAARAGTLVPGSGCTSGQADCPSIVRHMVVVNKDEWNDANDPRRMLTRIQSNLDRVSAGQPIWPAPSGEADDPVLKIVDAYADFLRSDFEGMDAALAKVDAAAAEQRASIIKHVADQVAKGELFSEPKTQKETKVYSASLESGEHNSSPLIRLYAGLRAANGNLTVPSPTDMTSLRFPCRTVIGRVPEFVAATDSLKSLGGPVLDCPVDGPIDYAKDEMLALHPASLSPHVTPPPAHWPATIASVSKLPSPGSREAALDEMGTHPQQAAPILEHYSNEDALGELDYMLFLQAFEPETSARDTIIRSLQADLQKKAMTSPRKVNDFPPTPYDGSDTSLLNIIRLASETGVANSDSAFYAIPCAILIARPALIAATDNYYGGNRDNFMPRSGCESGRGGMISEFPAEPVDAFEAASTEADGNFLEGSGTILYALGAYQNATNTKMRLNPRYFLNLNPPPFGYPPSNFDYPYQVWGYTSLNNYAVSLRLRKLYFAALDQVTNYYRKRMGIDQSDSRKAARIALFLATFGGDCGGGVPTTSIRRMLLEHASLKAIKQQLNGSDADAPEIDACAKYAGMDPLLLVAVGDSAAFSLVLQHAPDVNVRNPIGKTALMEAAQFDQLGIVKLLLAHHASINATTLKGSDFVGETPLGDDARTALMYAAANGSLQLIKTLLDAGADPFQADTKGYRAIDYLLGYGPTPPNPNLSAQQREQAARLLF